MLNIFPIMFLSLVAHALLRIITGGILCVLGYKHIRTYRAPVQNALFATQEIISPKFIVASASIELLTGLMLITGFLTQIAAIGVFTLSLGMIVFRKRLRYPLVPQPFFYVLLLAVSLSLFITGAGVFAIDLPL